MKCIEVALLRGVQACTCIANRPSVRAIPLVDPWVGVSNRAILFTSK